MLGFQKWGGVWIFSLNKNNLLNGCGTSKIKHTCNTNSNIPTSSVLLILKKKVQLFRRSKAMRSACRMAGSE